MLKPNKPTILILYFAVMLWSVGLRGESIEDARSAVSPIHTPGAGEFMHGTGYGKLMVRVVVLGAVPQQGVHYFPEGTDLVFGLLYAGGYTDNTKLNGISIRRRGQEKLIEVDLEDSIEDGKAIPKLQDGDVVNVPFNWHRDMQTILTVTGFITAITGFALSIYAISQFKTN